ncbi:MAG: hypothetical protein F6K04_01440 [Leptolyngbya sp. SIO4C5]|nr:hypothetical protein [Leptolyngbya sp. SIO4C5]
MTLKQILHTPPAQLSREQLEPLTKKELQALADLLGFPRSGRKAAIADRIMQLISISLVIRHYDPDTSTEATSETVNRLAAARSKSVLKQWATTCNLWASGNKYQLASVLIGWRRQCKATGQRNWNAAIADLKSKPRQLSLLTNTPINQDDRPATDRKTAAA